MVVTKSILLKRYDTVRLVEADAHWCSRSKVYLGRKRCQDCIFVNARLEELIPKTVLEWCEPADLVWLQWTLQSADIRYDITSTDNHHRLVIEMSEQGVNQYVWG